MTKFSRHLAVRKRLERTNDVRNWQRSKPALFSLKLLACCGRSSVRSYTLARRREAKVDDLGNRQLAEREKNCLPLFFCDFEIVGPEKITYVLRWDSGVRLRFPPRQLRAGKEKRLPPRLRCRRCLRDCSGSRSRSPDLERSCDAYRAFPRRPRKAATSFDVDSSRREAPTKVAQKHVWERKKKNRLC